MSHGFDWQTEDEAGWDEAATNAAAPPSRLRFLLPLLFGLIFITLIAVPLLWRQLRTQVVASVITRSEADVLAVHEVVLAAAANQDIQLFQEQLDAAPAVSGWRIAQAQLMEKSHWPGWDSLGLMWLGAAAAPTIILSPDYTQATITQTQRFQWFNPVTVQDEEITLTQRFTYRFHDDEGRWVLTANPNSGNQAWQTHSNPLAAFVYPEQGSDLSLRLASNITDEIARFCRQPGIPCEQVPVVTVRLDEHLTNLSKGSDDETGRLVRLPALTVTGYTEDEATVQVLQTLYTQQIVLFLLTQMRVGSGEYDLVSLEQVEDALVAVGLRPRNAPSSVLSPTLAGPPPIPWPDENIWLACTRDNPTLYTFSPAAAAWDVALSSPDLQAVYPLGNELVLEEIWGESNQSTGQLSLWRNGHTQLVFRYPIVTANQTSSSAILSTTPLADQWLLRHNVPEAGSPYYYLVNKQQCDETGCATLPLVGQPVWSPDGTQTLLVEPVAAPYYGDRIFLGDAAANPHTLIGTGKKPVWLDNHTIAYFELPPVEPSHLGPIDELVVLDSLTLTEQTRLTYSDFAATLSVAAGSFHEFYEVALLPDGQLLITFIRRFADPYYDYLLMVSYDPRTGQSDITAESPYLPAPYLTTWHMKDSTTPSPRVLFTGQSFTWWLTLQKSATDPLVEVELPAAHYLGSARPDVLPSPDGTWIAVLHGDWLTLLSPDPLYQMTVARPRSDCNGFWFLPPSSLATLSLGDSPHHSFDHLPLPVLQRRGNQPHRQGIKL